MSRKHVNCERKLMDTEHILGSCVLAEGVFMCILSKIRNSVVVHGATGEEMFTL